jgi:hypothetical protein
MKTIKQMIEETNKYIQYKQPIQNEWYEEVIFDFETIHEDVECKIVWESKVDEHRWYGLQDVVIELKHGDDVEFIKTTLVTQSYSESQSLSDIYHSYPEFKIVHPKKVETIVYE